MYTYEAHSTQDLDFIAREFARLHPDPGIFLLRGAMGAGKTTFVKAVCQVLHTAGTSSPTFSLANEYLTPEGKRILHLDLYRVRSLNEALDFGIEEYLDPGLYVFIEWPDIIEPLVKHEKSITIEDVSGVRKISF